MALVPVCLCVTWINMLKARTFLYSAGSRGQRFDSVTDLLHLQRQPGAAKASALLWKRAPSRLYIAPMRTPSRGTVALTSIRINGIMFAVRGLCN